MKTSALFLASLILSPFSAAEVSYNFDVKPILSDRCFLCHGFDDSHRAADLRLDTPEGAFAERDGKTPIVPGDPDASDVWQRIISTDPDLVMPTPESHLSLNDQEKDIIRQWIVEGANYERHWSFVAPERPELPEVQNDDWVKNPIDAFVLAKLEAEGLQPSEAADETTLRRRLALDLIGLPPGDQLVTSYEEQVDAFLNSPAFGEKWTFSWLEAARYADSNGFQGDPDRYAYPWRDYMIRALNENKPQDELIIELLAGDLLDNPTQDQLVATSFNRHHLLNDEGGALEDEVLFNYHIDRVDATATTFLGLTFACAQCHDHKYDPLTHEDYFSFMAFFSNMDEQGQPKVIRQGDEREFKVSEPVLKLSVPELASQLGPLQERFEKTEAALAPFTEEIETAELDWALNLPKDEVEKLPFPANYGVSNLRNKRGLNQEQRDGTRNYYLTEITENAEWRALQIAYWGARQAFEAVDGKVPVVMVMKERDTPAAERLRSGGAYDAPVGDPLPAAIPKVFGELPTEGEQDRLALARWMVSEENPLTARVMVNRVWQEIFGRGIVETSEDFGFQGALPTHPKLLDWLAVEFVESGWDFKHLVRTIVTSRTYQQSSKLSDKLLERDPENKLLARGPRFRMRAAQIRDQALAVSGLLKEQLYGPPVYPLQPEGMWREVSFGKFSYPQKSEADQIYRRSLYTFWRRTQAPPSMFDSSDRQICSVKPEITNTPLQALTLLNDETYHRAARTLAEQALEQSEPLQFLFERITSRLPNANELQILTRAYQRELEAYDEAPELNSLALVASTLLNLDETLTKE